MNNLNSVILEGNLVKDPEGRLTPKGTPVCLFTLASNRSYKLDGVRQDEVSYIDIEVWGKIAESCEKHLRKGRGARIVGRLKQDRWTDSQGGQHYRVKIVGEHVDFNSLNSAGGKDGKTQVKEPLGGELEEEALIEEKENPEDIKEDFIIES